MDRKIRFTVVGTANRGLFTFARRLLYRQGRGRPEFPQRAEVALGKMAGGAGSAG